MTNIYECLVPNYFKDFKCKGSMCRNSCCVGWRITLSLSEYYHLLGMDCKKRLRDKIDISLHIVNNPSNERYAFIQPNYYNDCPLHQENGYCQLQCERGEKDLPSICKNYPRNYANKFVYECSCSASCEKTLELLFANYDKVTFEKRELVIEKFKDIKTDDENRIKDFINVRNICYNIMTNRNYSLVHRLIILGKAFKEMKDDKDFESLNKYFDYSNIIDEEVNYIMNLKLQLHIIDIYRESNSIASYIGVIDNLYNEKMSDEEKLNNYLNALNSFHIDYPKWEIMAEKVLVNHMFFNDFPFSYDLNKMSFYDEYVSLVGTFAFVNFLVVGYMYYKKTMDDLVDLIAAAFRLIEHSSFDINIDMILRNEKIYDLSDLERILVK